MEEDETFERYKRHLQALGPGSGRSRPCKLEPVSALTNHLLLQFGLLRLTCNVTWSMMSDFSAKLVNIRQRLDTLVLGTEMKAEKLNFDDKDAVLLFLEEEMDLVYPTNSPYCVKFQVTKAFLLHEQDAVVPQPQTIVQNGLVIELERFKRERKLNAADVFGWLSVLCPNEFTSKQINKKITDLMKKYRKITQYRSKKPDEYDSLLEATFELQPRARTPKDQTASGDMEVDTSDGHASSPLLQSDPYAEHSGKAEEYEKELKSVKSELKEVETLLEELLARQTKLLDRQTELEAVLQNHATAKLKQADLKWEKKDFPWSLKLQDKLQSVFKMKELRPMQLQTMNATMAGRDCFLIMPTGGGKSLCFQLPALLSEGITLVVSPLVSLMEDQVMALEHFDVEAVMLNADAGKTTVNRVQDAMIDPKSPLRLIYVTPEKLAKSKRFMNRLEKMYGMGRFARLVIDEVHCCSQWGHDFRPDYKFLGIMKRQFPKVPLLGLTATATVKVLEDVKTILNVPDCLLLRSSFNRPNLYYQVRPKPASHEEVMTDMSQVINTRFPQQSGIVYCFSQRESEEVARDLKKKGIKCLCYHASMPAKERSHAHNQWAGDHIQVIVATVAFGMGIDKPDVRFVIHHSLSKSMENLYQESGRAGRDSKTSHCILYYRFADVARQSTMVFTERTGLENLYGIVAYCCDVSQCRRSRIARHFGEVWDSTQCAGMCDHCDPAAVKSSAKRDITSLCQDVLKIMTNAAASNQRLTAQKILDAWYGKGAPTLRVKEVKVPGISRDKAERILAHMLLEGFIREDFHFTAYSTICYLVKGSRAKTLLAGSTRVTLEFEGKTPAASSTGAASSTAKVNRTPTACGDSTAKVKPVIINTEKSHFSSFAGRKPAPDSVDQTAGSSSGGPGSSRSSTSCIGGKLSTGKKRKPVISDDDDDTDGGGDSEDRGKRSKSSVREDLEGLVFDDDSDFDVPKKKRRKHSDRATSSDRNKVKCRNPSDSIAVSQNGQENVLDDTDESNPICVTDSE